MNSNTSTSAGKGIPFKAFAITLLVALLGVAGAYFYGLSQGRAALAAQKAQFATQIQSVRAETQRSKEEVVAVNNHVRLLDAQNGLYRAAVALDKRNFGIANTALQGAASALGRVKASPDFPVARVQALGVALGKFDINVAANLEDQRAKILGFAEQMEDLTTTKVPVGVPSEATPDGTNADALTPDGGTPAPDGSTQPSNENAVSSENAASNSASGNAAQ